MDALDPRERDDSIVSTHPVLFETADDPSESGSPMSRLPTELTTLILRECRSDIRHRLTVTHICRQWRQIVVNDARMWTDICIHTMFRDGDTCLDHFLSFLGMQLDRTADLLLDVQWIAEVEDEFFVPTLQLIRRKAPFSRWRTLCLHLSGRLRRRFRWSNFGAFTNLESLFVWNGTDNTIIRIIDKKITSQLDVLDLRTWPVAWHVNMKTSFAKSFTRISSLLLGSLPSDLETSFLPPNVVSLQLDQAQEHPFPHIRTYMLKGCMFLQANTVNLGNVTTLIVSGPIRIACRVLLQALMQLTLETLWMGSSASIEAPALNTLHFIKEYILNTDDLSWTDRSLQGPGYLLSPNTSIIADSHLSRTALLNLLVKSPKVTHATLRFNDWAGARAMLKRFAGFRVNKISRPEEEDNLCPRLSEVRLDFNWRLSASSRSKKWLIDRIKARRDAGITPSLSIYACWKEEGSYVLLTGE